MKGWLWLIALVGMTGAGLPTAASAQDVDCEEESWGDHSIVIENIAPRPGAVLGVRPQRLDGPFGVKDVERSCVRGWRVRPRGAARLTRDRTQLILDDDVEPGTRITVEARVGDTRTAAEFTVVGTASASIRGEWRRECPAPEGSAPIQRLILFEEDYFLFDSLERQWSGSYAFDPDTGAVSFGPYILPPPEAAKLEGVARVEGDRLVLDGVFFADPWNRPAGEDCPMVFSRQP